MQCHWYLHCPANTPTFRHLPYRRHLPTKSFRNETPPSAPTASHAALFQIVRHVHGRWQHVHDDAGDSKTDLVRHCPFMPWRSVKPLASKDCLVLEDVKRPGTACQAPSLWNCQCSTSPGIPVVVPYPKSVPCFSKCHRSAVSLLHCPLASQQ